MKSKVYAAILAGGKGTRLWPLSGKTGSKSFVKIGDKEPMIKDSIKRIQKLVGKNNILFVVDKKQSGFFKKTIEGKLKNNIIVEPFGRNTAAALGLAAISVKPDDIVVALPTDTFVDNDKAFQRSLRTGVDYIKKNPGNILCIGIIPTEPSTGYGYIDIERKANGDVYRVENFIEKPTREKAEELIRSGHHLWNAGIFIFRVSDMLCALNKYMPDLFVGLMEIAAQPSRISAIYKKFENTSIDYGVMEKARNIFCVKAGFTWCDLGSWTSISRLFKKDTNGNVTYGKVRLIDTKDSFVYNSTDRLTALIGGNGIIVANTGNGTLVTAPGKAEKVKELNIL